jgi:hypothetical protein
VPKHAPDLLPIAVDTQLLAVAETVRDRLALLTRSISGCANRSSSGSGSRTSTSDAGR